MPTRVDEIRGAHERANHNGQFGRSVVGDLLAALDERTRERDEAMRQRAAMADEIEREGHLRAAYEQLVTSVAEALGVEGDIDDGSPILAAVERLKSRADDAEISLRVLHLGACDGKHETPRERANCANIYRNKRVAELESRAEIAESRLASREKERDEHAAEAKKFRAHAATLIREVDAMRSQRDEARATAIAECAQKCDYAYQEARAEVDTRKANDPAALDDAFDYERGERDCAKRLAKEIRALAPKVADAPSRDDVAASVDRFARRLDTALGNDSRVLVDASAVERWRAIVETGRVLERWLSRQDFDPQYNEARDAFVDALAEAPAAIEVSK